LNLDGLGIHPHAGPTELAQLPLVVSSKLGGGQEGGEERERD